MSPCFQGDPGPGYYPKDHGPYPSESECDEDCSQLGACCTPTGCEQRTRCDCRPEDGNSFAGIEVPCEPDPCNCFECETCTSDYDRITITLTGLPADCLNRSQNYSEGDWSHKYITRDLSDWNGCSFRMFRLNTQQCVYRAMLPGFQNVLWYCDGFDLIVALDLNADTLTLRNFVSSVTFRPESGSTFREFPYSGGVVVQQSSWPVCDLSDVQIAIDNTTPTFLPTYCPGGTVGCDPDEDIVQREESLIPSPFPTCEPCGEDAIVFRSPTSTSDDSVPELTASITFGEMDIDSLFEAGEPPGQSTPANPGTIPGFSSMSGSYSLKYPWLPFRRVQHFNNDWSLAGASPFWGWPGGFSTALAGCGWGGLFYSTPYGEEDTGNGYEMKYSNGDPLRAVAALEIAVVPIGWHMPYNYGSKSMTYSRCSDGQVSHQVRIIGYMIYPGFADSGFGYYVYIGYWNQVFAYYGSVACSELPCREKPSFSLSGTIHSVAPAVYLTDTYWAYATSNGKVSFPFSLSVS